METLHHYRESMEYSQGKSYITLILFMLMIVLVYKLHTEHLNCSFQYLSASQNVRTLENINIHFLFQVNMSLFCS